MIADNIRKVRQDIEAVCQRLGRNPREITLVAITKTAGAGEIQQAIAAGITDFGENRIQQAEHKYLSLKNAGLKFHLVGHLQTNKIKPALEIFDLIHSLDSLHLAQQIDKIAAKLGKPADSLLEINVSGEKSKFGLRPEELSDFLEVVSRLKYLRIMGLMTVAPLVENPEEVRVHFRNLRLLKEKIDKLYQFSNLTLQYLSMGMTNDYKIALEEGSNMLRIGRAIFEG
jgi:pyridoxal phosphate enzyme (YggS family)